MNAGELKKALETVPDDTEILLYLRGSEEAGHAHGLEAPVKMKDADTKYTKNDSPMNPRYFDFPRDNPDKLMCWLVGW